MRTVLRTVFLVVALQAIASAATVLASPTAVDASAAAGAASDANRFDANAVRTPSSLRVQTERESVRSEAQVLSKNFPRPKPVQIYWFFGGR